VALAAAYAASRAKFFSKDSPHLKERQAKGKTFGIMPFRELLDCGLQLNPDDVTLP